MNIAAQIRELREAGDLTLAQVSEASGLSISYLSDLERGRTEPSLDALRAIARAYGLELHIALVDKAPKVVHISRKRFRALINQARALAKELDTLEDESEDAS